MSKEIREIPYNLYLGNDVRIELHTADVVDRYKIGKLIGCYIDQWENGNYHPTVQIDWGYKGQRGYYKLYQCKLILRKLSSMTEEEFEEFKKLSDNDFSKMVLIESMIKDGPSYTRLCHSAFAQQYLLSKGFDLFNLIDRGLALDSDSKQ